MGNLENNICFVIPGKIVPKQSTRFASHRAFTSDRVTKYAKYVKECYREAYPIDSMPFEFKSTPLTAIINVYFEVPKSDSKCKREEKLSLGFPTKVPDLDNCTKSILDALKGMVFPDDAQIVNLVVTKRWAEESYVEVTIFEAKRFTD